MNKKSNFFITLLLIVLTFNVHSMEKENDNNKKGWLAFAGDTLLYGVETFKQFLLHANSKSEPFGFSDLPQEIQETIIFLLAQNSNASTLDNATQAINSLCQVNKQLHNFINNPQFCLTLIKHLSQQFDCSNETAAMALQTQEAKNRLTIQKQFQTLFQAKRFDEQTFNQLYALHQKYVDLNFTYRDLKSPKIDNKDTLLITAAMYKNRYKLIKIVCLLNTHALNINYQNRYGSTALIQCACTCDDPETLFLLCNTPTININLQDDTKNTALSHACWCITKTYKFTCINILLKAGANPTITNELGQTPLQIIRKTGDNATIELIRNAVKKYHSST